MKKGSAIIWIFVVVCLFSMAGCSTGSGQPTESAQVEVTAVLETAVPTATVSPTDTPEPAPTETAVPPTATPAPTQIPRPTPTIDYQPLFPIGSTADWTATTDAVGIEGTVEFISATQLTIRDFVFFATEAPGVDIRLGVDRNFDEGVAVSLKDITGDSYDGASLTLTIPDEAFDGRQFNSIGVVCYDNGDIFDWAVIQPPSSVQLR